MQSPPHHESVEFRRHFKLNVQLILEHMPSMETSTERRLLKRMLEHEEQAEAHAQALLESLLEQAEPQEVEKLPFSRRLRAWRSNAARTRRSRQRNQAKPQDEEEAEEEAEEEEAEEEEQAEQQADPISSFSLREAFGLGQINRPSPDVARVPLPERIHWHPLRGPKPMWIPWPRGIAANSALYNESFDNNCCFIKYGTRLPKRAVISECANRFWHCPPQHPSMVPAGMLTGVN